MHACLIITFNSYHPGICYYYYRMTLLPNVSYYDPMVIGSMYGAAGVLTIFFSNMQQRNAILSPPILTQPMAEPVVMLFSTPRLWGSVLHYYKILYLSRFLTAFSPGFSTGTVWPGQM